jgi:uncharacterized protein YdeI (YjbR/CyaY-like superfamily)
MRSGLSGQARDSSLVLVVIQNDAMATSEMNPKVDAVLRTAQKWQEEFGKLRKIALSCPLTEELKWGQPCYSLEGANIVLIHGFKDYCALLFFKGALLKDTKGLLVQQTENVQAARQIRFKNLKEITKLEPVLKAYIKEAIEVEKAGMEVEYKKTSEFAMPEEFEKKLKGNAALKKAFEALTPGRQRGYLLHFAAAKQSTTRESRIEKCTPQILAGKGLLDRPADSKGKGDAAAKASKLKKNEDGVVLLSGGNPQIAKADGDAPVQAYIAAMPGWKSEIGKRLDAIVTRTVPGVKKAVKWNSPFYGVEGKGWFLNVHCLTKYVKVTFFAGKSLKPNPPGSTPKSGEARWINIHEGEFDEAQIEKWVKQAAKLPGWSP